MVGSLSLARIGVAVLLYAGLFDGPVSSRSITPQPGGAPKAPLSSIIAARKLDEFGKLSLSFELVETNDGQRRNFVSRGHGYSLWLGQGEAKLRLQRPAVAQRKQLQDRADLS